MEEPVRLPWRCDDKDCHYGWHVMQYEYDDNFPATDEAVPQPVLIDAYADGNWEPTDDSMPTYEEVERAWTDYCREVAQSGEDPLGEIMVAREIEQVQEWQAKVRDSLLGVLVTQCKRNHRYFHPANTPKEVKEYLELVELPARRFVIGPAAEIKSLDDLRVHTTINRWGYITFTVTVKKPRNPNTIRREIKAIARQRVQRDRTPAPELSA